MMPGAFISKERVEELAQDIRSETAPSSVIAILQQYELQVMRNLQPDNLHPEDAKSIASCMSFHEIFQSVRDRLWKGRQLPDTFPKTLRPWPEEMLDMSQSDIGVATKDDVDIQEVQSWVLEKLKGTSISFEPRTWFDGPASVNIVPTSEIPSELLTILLQKE